MRWPHAGWNADYWTYEQTVGDIDIYRAQRNGNLGFQFGEPDGTDRFGVDYVAANPAGAWRKAINGCAASEEQKQIMHAIFAFDRSSS